MLHSIHLLGFKLCVALVVRTDEYEMKRKSDSRGDYFRLLPEPVVRACSLLKAVIAIVFAHALTMF